VPRSPSPEKRAAILDRCFAAAQSLGSLDLSLPELAARTGVSPRMLVYHFGSREGLQRALAARLEEDLRERFAAFEAAAPSGGTAAAVLALWDHLSAAEMRGPLRLAMDVVHRAQRGGGEDAALGMREVDAWTAFLASRVPDPGVATGLIVLFLGAALDLLVSGDPGRGRRAIEVFLGAAGGPAR
jgi:AcrR family transcriptional regulator